MLPSWVNLAIVVLVLFLPAGAFTQDVSATHVVRKDGLRVEDNPPRAYCPAPLLACRPAPLPTMDPCEPYHQSQEELENPDLAADTPTLRCTPTPDAR